MNILYVSGMPGPLISILSGEDKIQGLPAFYYPWKMLVDRGHNVDFVVLSNFNGPYNIRVDWFSEKHIIKNIYAPHTEISGLLRLPRRLSRFLKLLYHAEKAVKKKHYDFIYCLAFEGVVGQLVANWHHIPNGVRSFGDRLFLEIEKYGARRTAIRHPLEYLCYRLNTNFFLMTQDHKEPLTYKAWHNPKHNYPFYFWPSGIEFKELEDLKCTIELPSNPYLFLAARIDPMRRQDRGIVILRELHKRNCKLHLYFAGGTYLENWKKQLEDQIKEYGLNEYVHFLGSIPQDDLKNYAHHAIANFMMADGINRTNVFYESMSIGAVVIGLDNSGINDYIANGESGFIVKSELEAVPIIEELVGNDEKRDAIKEAAKLTAKEKTMSIETRFGKEVDLIEQFK